MRKRGLLMRRALEVGLRLPMKRAERMERKEVRREKG